MNYLCSKPGWCSAYTVLCASVSHTASPQTRYPFKPHLSKRHLLGFKRYEILCSSKTLLRNLLMVQWVRTPLLSTQVQSLVRELKSHKSHYVAKKNLIIIKTTKLSWERQNFGFSDWLLSSVPLALLPIRIVQPPHGPQPIHFGTSTKEPAGSRLLVPG